MSDPRESILARLRVIAASVPGVVTAVRNITSWSDTSMLPGIAVLEGDEEANEEDKTAVRTVLVPRRVYMTPQLVIAVGDLPEDVGTTLNALRWALIRAVLQDETLLALTLNSLGVKYVGMQSALALGRQMQGQMALTFSISYWLDPSTA